MAIDLIVYEENSRVRRRILDAAMTAVVVVMVAMFVVVYPTDSFFLC